MPIPLLAAAALGGGAGLKLFGLRSKSKARKHQKEVNRLEQERRAVANVVARRQAASAIRRQQASVAAMAVASGGEGGSAAANALSNVTSQGEARIAEQSQLQDLDQDRFNQQRKSNSRMNQAAGFDAAAGLAMKAGTAVATGGASLGLDFTKPGG